jgi:gluconolactonase
MKHLSFALLLVWPLAAQAPTQTPEIAATTAFNEGPATDRAGNIYFTDIINQRIMKLATDGQLTVYREHSNAANGLVIDAQDRLIACEGALLERPGVKVQGKRQVTRTDLKTGKIEVLTDNYMGKPYEGPNDATFDSKGRIYFTDLAGSAVYRIDAPGKVTRLLAAPNIQRANGIQISPDDKKLYVIEANGAKGGARQVSVWDLAADGNVNVASKKLHYNFSPGRSGDGMSIDTQGNLWVSAGMNQLRGTDETVANKTGIYVISPAGKLLKFIPIPEDYITNNTFAGADRKTMYITAGKTLYKIRTDVAGLVR